MTLPPCLDRPGGSLQGGIKGGFPDMGAPKERSICPHLFGLNYLIGIV